MKDLKKNQCTIQKDPKVFLRIKTHVVYGTLMQHRKLHHVASQKLSQGTTN